jgi:hypothetical protein
VRFAGETGFNLRRAQYDLRFPDDTHIPKPNDSEVDSFNLYSTKEVLQLILAGEFKPNCALVYAPLASSKVNLMVLQDDRLLHPARPAVVRDGYGLHADLPAASNPLSAAWTALISVAASLQCCSHQRLTRLFPPAPKTGGGASNGAGFRALLLLVRACARFLTTQNVWRRQRYRGCGVGRCFLAAGLVPIRNEAR